MFSHGQFINAVAWLIERKPQDICGQAMADWREYEIKNHVPYGGGYILFRHVDADDWRICSQPSQNAESR
ncbi:Phosphoglycerate mutase protein [Pseudomonas syringae pv. syringae]|nr:Phosphoglycerate mutase protein [Pseudomonas syringae pv. syringae]